jgi:hypothetical protein
LFTPDLLDIGGDENYFFGDILAARTECNLAVGALLSRPFLAAAIDRKGHLEVRPVFFATLSFTKGVCQHVSASWHVSGYVPDRLERFLFQHCNEQSCKSDKYQQPHYTQS